MIAVGLSPVTSRHARLGRLGPAPAVLLSR
jgi:hypothetical protein